MKKLWAVLCLGIFLLPGITMAQEQYGFTPQDWDFTLQGSGSSDDELDNTTLSFEFSLGYFLTSGLELGLRQGLGYSDALYLDARETRYIEELSGANFLVILRVGTLVAPALGSILPGGTRDSILRVAREIMGMLVVER